MAIPKPYQISIFDQIQQEKEKRTAIVFDMAAGKKLADVGAEMAAEHADQKVKGWSLLCWQLFLLWLRRNVKRGNEFMIEDFRMHVKNYDLLETPPSNRAFGVIPKKGKDKFFQFVRIAKVKNKTAHGANASVWMKL